MSIFLQNVARGSKDERREDRIEVVDGGQFHFAARCTRFVTHNADIVRQSCNGLQQSACRRGIGFRVPPGAGTEVSQLLFLNVHGETGDIQVRDS